MKTTLAIGQKVITKVATTPYYGTAELPSGIVGIVGAADVACVRLRATCKCSTFYCVDLPGRERAAYHGHELQAVAPEVI